MPLLMTESVLYLFQLNSTLSSCSVSWHTKDKNIKYQYEYS